jgi:hypothetical protein
MACVWSFWVWHNCFRQDTPWVFSCLISGVCSGPAIMHRLCLAFVSLVFVVLVKV